MNTTTTPTTAEMKAALATIQPVKAPNAVSSSGLNFVADSIALTAAGTVTGIGNVGTGTVNFVDRIATGYKFQRALDTGKLRLEVPALPKRSRKA